MATPSATLQAITDIENLIPGLRLAVLDNLVVPGQTAIASINTKVDALKVILDACSQVAGDDFNTLT